MKKTLQAIFCGLLVFLAFYLIGAFVELSFNIGEWSKDGRGFVGIIGGLLAISTTVGTRIILEEFR